MILSVTTTERPPTPLVVMNDPGVYPDTLTRSEMEKLRGGLTNGNGAGDLAVPLPRPESVGTYTPPKLGPRIQSPARTCALDGCGAVLTGRPEQLYCSRSHQRRASYARRQAAPIQNRIAEDAPEYSDDRSPAQNRTPAPEAKSGLLDLVAAAAAALPLGWDLTVAAGEVTLRWSTT
jgi:hypothetical protein